MQESNARYVKWSDGSESIVLGDEVLDIDRKDHGKSHTYLYAVRYDVIEVGWARCLPSMPQTAVLQSIAGDGVVLQAYSCLAVGCSCPAPHVLQIKLQQLLCSLPSALVCLVLASSST